MGRLAIVIVLGLSLTAGIVGYNLNRSKTALTENVTSFDKYTNARNLAHTGVNMMLRRLDRNDSSVTNPLSRSQTAWLVTNVMSGLCSVSVKLSNPPALDTIDVKSKSKFIDSTYTMNLRLYRSPVPFPGINAAVNLASSPITFDMKGTPSIDGRNWNMDGTLNPDRTTDTNGVSVVTAAESTLVAGFGSKITGDPKKVTKDPPPDPGPYVAQYLAGTDVTFADGSVNSGNYGTAAAPVIGYVNGNVKFNGNGSFYGILVVHGNLDFAGTFDMYGLVICYGDSNVISVSTSSGTPVIWGSIIQTGPSGSSFTMKGTADVRYSAAAMKMAQYINKLQVYRVMRWYE
jgi:hypothetical protein